MAESSDQTLVQIRRDLNEIRLRQRLDQLTLEWTLERQKLLGHNRYGTTSVPSPGVAKFFLLGMSLLGTLVMLVGVGINGPKEPSALFVGLLVIGMAVWVYVIVRDKAQRYQHLECTYKRRRQLVLDEIESVSQQQSRT